MTRWQGGSSATVPARDRFDWFSDVVATALAPTMLSTDHATDFHAEGAALEFGDVQLSRFSYSPVRSRRTAASIRKSDPEQYQLGLVTQGSMWLSQHGAESGMFSGDFVLWDTSRPYEAGCGQADPAAGIEAFVLQVPKAQLPIPSQRVDRLLARRIPGTAGLGAILSQFVVSLAGNGPDCGPEELLGLRNMAVDLASSCMAQHLGHGHRMSEPLRAHALLHRIDAFIEQQLAEPDLTPRVIAASHHISLRHLYNLFEPQGEGVAESIRRRRLERCRTDLANPDLRRHSVQAIAARWSFTSAAAFSRTFRATYGTTPTEYRARALDPAGGSTAGVSTARRAPARLAVSGDQPERADHAAG